MNVGEVVHSSTIQKLAVLVLKQCSGHLLATVLMARALKEVKDVRIWQHASRVISFLPTSHTEDRILLNALSFVLGHLGSANKYVKYCASYLEIEGTYKVDLLERWMNEDLIGTLDEGEQIVQHLVNALLLESFQNGQSIRMRDEIRKELMNFYKAETNPILLVELDGRGLMEAPKNEAWEEANEMHLMNNKISKLPDNPNSPKLSVLFLQDAGDDRYGVLQSLEYLYLHYMKNLRSIWKGPPIWMGSLSNLKVLALHTCPELATIFTFNILQQCCNLEELVVEDCPEINSIVNHKVLAKDVGPWAWYLPKLKKMSIHYMPKLASISQGVLIAPNLEWLSLYDCPSLKILSPEEVSSCKLKVIIGEADWWSALEWKKSEWFQPPNLDAIFVPIERDIDLRTQLAEINDQLQAQMQKTEPSQQSGPGDSLKAPAVEAGTSAKQKQMKLGHLFMKWPLSEFHPFLIQVP
ncbi:probable disease resistance protein At4g27220 [Vitis riparia]|uniref:probable disease resistance protein At4g27220 n=1 Tax=Vitis riparia TaxID=96939 RepID=UPI00155B3A81|nr:probable disease resistance protein At4g27220 [Vitis riparia]